MTTEAAQRRLLEALSALDRAGCAATPPTDALAELVGGMAVARGLIASALPPLARVYEALEDLALAVRADNARAADEVRYLDPRGGSA